MDSTAEFYRREAANMIEALMRPSDRDWFRLSAGEEDIDADIDAARTLSALTKRFRTALYDRRSMFITATKEIDADFMTLGNGVIMPEFVTPADGRRPHLFMRTFHLKNVVWLDNAYGQPNHVHVRMKMTARKMIEKFGDKNCAKEVKEAFGKEPNKEFEVRFICMPCAEYDSVTMKKKSGSNESAMKIMARKKHPYVGIYVDVAHCKVLKEGYWHQFPFVIPRWLRHNSSQYAWSQATAVMLPDARQMQVLARVITEASEKAIDPPLVGTEEAVHHVDLRAGKLSWIDNEYDERLGAALRPLEITYDIQAGLAMRRDLQEKLAKAFYIDKMNLPDTTQAKTAYEISLRHEEFVRGALPLLAPIQSDYHAPLLETSFSVLMNEGWFDDIEIPEILAGMDAQWSFETPIRAAAERLRSQQFQESLNLTLAASQAKQVPGSPIHIDLALQDSIRGVQVPPTWLKNQAELAQEAEIAAAKQQQEAAMAEMAQGAVIADKVGQASQSLIDGQVLGNQPLQLPAAEEVEDPAYAAFNQIFGEQTI